MANGVDACAADGSHLRGRPSIKALHLHNSNDAKQKVLELNDQEDSDDKSASQKRTYGRTPDGTGMSPFRSLIHNESRGKNQVFNNNTSVCVYLLTLAL